MATQRLHCDQCAQQREFERPICLDGHGSDCPEWACTECGAAILISPMILLMDRRPRVIVRSTTDRTRKAGQRRAA